MLDRYQPVAWMIAGAERSLPRERMLEIQHLAELRIVDDRPPLLARAIERVRDLLAPSRAAHRDPACCPA